MIGERRHLILLSVLAVVSCTSAQYSRWSPRTPNLNADQKGQGHVPCPRDLPLSKLMFNQSDYIQYVHYITPIPDIASFTLQYWFNLISTDRTSTMFDYTKKGIASLLIQLEGGHSQKWNLIINDELIASVASPPVKGGEWHHMVHSWDSNNGLWSVYMDGVLLSANRAPLGKRIVLPGGGDAVSGQRQSTLGDGMDRREGLEGWFTLLQMSRRPLLYPHSQQATSMISTLTSQCQGSSHGDIISWTRTPRKGYGGVMEAPSRKVCGHF